jgi:hypothetical protein
VKRLAVLLTVAALMAALLLPADMVTAQERETEVVRVEVGPSAKLTEDGQFVRVKVKVTCQPVDHILEALLFAQQEGAYGEGFLRSVVCDGKTHVHMEEVEASDGAFRPGEAFVSAFVLVCLDAECAQSAQGQETRLVRVVGS